MCVKEHEEEEEQGFRQAWVSRKKARLKGQLSGCEAVLWRTRARLRSRSRARRRRRAGRGACTTELTGGGVALGRARVRPTSHPSSRGVSVGARLASVVGSRRLAMKV